MTKDKKLNIAFAGGGSGGHVMPISSLIRYILAPNTFGVYKSEKYSDLVDNIFWFGQRGQMEEKEFEKLHKYIYGDNRRDNSINCPINQNNINISKATIDDFESIQKINNEGWLGYINNNIGITEEAIDRFQKKIRNNRLDSKESFIKNMFVVKINNETIGYTKFFVTNKNINLLHSLYIKKEYQNKGIGKILLDKSFEFFDYQDIYLEVVEYNHKAIGFYKKYGFEVVDGRMELYDIGDNVKLPNITMLRKGNKSENSNNIYISKAKEKDAEDIAKFRLEFWYDVYGKIIPGLTMQGVKNRLSPQTQKYIDEIKKQIIDKNNICIIKDKDILVGYFKPGGYYEDGIDSGSIYILPKYQHTGIGTKFIKNFLSDNKDKNIYGEIAKNNKQSIDFCIKNGFIKYSQGGNYEYIDGSSTTYIDCDIYKLNKSENPYSLNDKESDKKSLVPMVFLPILSGKLRRQPDFKEILLNIADLFKFMIGIFQSLWYIYTNKIDVVFCKGGYVALPVVIAAKMLGRKILVHESDTKSGLVNKIAAKFADHIYTGFPGVLAREQVVGQIISDDIVTEDFGRLNQKIPEDKKTTILVNLGSLGSASVHDALMYIFEEYPEFLVNYEWHIILGSLNANYENKYNDIVTAASSTSDNLSNCPYDITTYLFVDQKKMGELLYICDISICRGGTTTLAEQKLFGIKQLIIPIPRTHDQAKNAKYYESHFDDIYIKQDKNTNILGDNIYNEIIGLSAFRKHKTDLDTIISEIQTAKKIICEEIIRG